MSRHKNTKPIGDQLARTTDTLLDKMKAYFIEKDLWDFENDKPIPQHKIDRSRAYKIPVRRG